MQEIARRSRRHFPPLSSHCAVHRRLGLDIQQNLANLGDGLLVVRRGPGLSQQSSSVAGDGTFIREVNVLKRMFNVAMEFERVATNPAQRARAIL